MWLHVGGYAGKGKMSLLAIRARTENEEEKVPNKTSVASLEFAVEHCRICIKIVSRDSLISDLSQSRNERELPPAVSIPHCKAIERAVRTLSPVHMTLTL
jgi:hypothetical protein